MPYSEELAARIRGHLKPMADHFHEKKMFGGLSFLYNGKMSVGIIKEELVVRVVSEKFDKTLEKKYVRPMDFNGKPMKDFVYVEPPAFQSETQLAQWINLGIEHAERACSSK